MLFSDKVSTQNMTTVHPVDSDTFRRNLFKQK